jgi:hypothetical protein
LVKLDQDGNVLWAKSFGDALDNEPGVSATFDEQGDVFAVVQFTGVVDLGTGSLQGSSEADLALARYAPDGQPKLVRHFSEPGNQAAYAIDVRSGRVLVAGWFDTTLSFGGVPTIGTPNSSDAYVALLDGADATHLRTGAYGAEGEQIARTARFDPDGHPIVAGSFTSSIDLGAGPLTSLGETDVFVAKLPP